MSSYFMSALQTREGVRASSGAAGAGAGAGPTFKADFSPGWWRVVQVSCQLSHWSELVT